MEQDCHALIFPGLVFFLFGSYKDLLSFRLSLYPDLWIYKTFASRNFHIKNSFDTRNKHTARFLYVLYKIHNNNKNSTKTAALSLTFFSFLTFIWCRFWLLFYMAQNLRKKYFALSKKNEGKCTHSFSTSVYWTFEGEQNFFSMKAATIHEDTWKLYSVFVGFSSSFHL